MNTIQISILTPYRENVRGTSALPYHLMAKREKGIKLEIYSFNCNNLSKEQIAEVEQELDVKIRLIPLPAWFRWIFKLHLLFVRVFLKYPLHNYITLPKDIEKEIRAKKPDMIWVYGEEMSRISRMFPDTEVVHTLPDSEALYYHRMLGCRFVMNDWKKYWRCAIMYRKFRRMERDFANRKNITYHLVGEEDAKFLRDMNPGIRARFIRHPHYEVKDTERKISFHKDKIRLLIAGQYNYYMQQDADEMVAALASADNRDMLQEHFVISFLGRGWEQHVRTLKETGWTVNHVKFAPDYIEEVCKHDIQITPISIGTGTKGKVLDALANGLMVIGSWYAMENIAVGNCVSCVVYDNPADMPRILSDIAANREKYEEMARRGREAVFKEHCRNSISTHLFNLNVSCRCAQADS